MLAVSPCAVRAYARDAARAAARVPGKLAIVDGQTRLTFAEPDAAVSRTAAALAAEGLGKGDRLALLSHNCWQFAVLSFATARLGVVLVPVNFKLGPGEIAYVLHHSQATAFVAEDGLAATAGLAVAVAGPDVPVRAVIGLRGEDVPAGWAGVQQWIDREGTPPPADVDDDDPVRLMYTSGTESKPKGALLSSRSLMWQYVSCVVDGGMDGDDVEVHAMPLYHCAQLDCFLGPDIYLGAASIVLPAPDPAAILATIESQRATKLFCPPTVWIALLRSPRFGGADLGSLRKGYYGASAMPVEVLRELRERLPGIRLWNFYGQAEMAPLATILGPDEQVSRAGSAGRAALNVETRLVDDDDRPVPRSGDQAHPRAASRLQDPQARHHRRRHTEKSQRQDPQAATPARAQHPRTGHVIPSQPRAGHPGRRQMMMIGCCAVRACQSSCRSSVRCSVRLMS